jgi:hypothetical protein
VRIDAYDPYKLATKRGLLAGTFSRKCSEICKQTNLLKINKVNQANELSVHESVSAESLTCRKI